MRIDRGYAVMNKRGNEDNPWRAAGLVGVMGIDIAVCMYLGYFIADRLAGTRGWLVFGLVVGLAVGILTCVMLLKRVMEDADG